MSKQGRRLSLSSPEADPGLTTRLPRRATCSPPANPPLKQEERVKVVVRVRPPNETETPGGVIINADETKISIQRKNANAVQTDFNFDKVLGPGADQMDVYEAAVRPIVHDVLQGYNGTIMAYGQTGAGKTYTLSSISSADNIGMMPRAASHLFSEIAADPVHAYNVVMAYVQIYNESIQDLLKPANGDLTIREGSNGVFVSGVEEQPVGSMHDCMSLMQLGEQNRKVAFTSLNAHSSRSHAIIMLTIVKRKRNALKDMAPDEEKMKVGKLFIVDLAGSERLKKSNSTGMRATEAKAINGSLTTLGICINSRADPNSKHTPYRDSKLTRLLQESLKGNAKTSLVVAVANAQEHADETLQSLQFGSRAMHVQIKAVVNESVGSKLLNADLLARLANMEVSTCLVDASLLAKEEELEKIQEALQGERDRTSKMIAALQAEKETEQAMKEQELSKAQAEIWVKQQEAERHNSKLKATAEKLASIEERHKLEINELRSQLEDAEQSLAEMANQLARGEEAKKLAAEDARQKRAADLDKLRSMHSAALRQAASEQARALKEAQAQIQAAVSDKNEEIRCLNLAHEEKITALAQNQIAAIAEAESKSEERIRVQAVVYEDKLRNLEARHAAQTSSHEQSVTALEAKLEAQASSHRQSLQDLEGKLKDQALSHKQTVKGLESKLESESRLVQGKEQQIAELTAQLESSQEETQLLLESMARDQEQELKDSAKKHRAEVLSLHTQLDSLRLQAAEREEELSHNYAEELQAKEVEHKAVVQGLIVEAKAIEAKKQADLEQKSAEYCQQLTAVAMDNQKATDSFYKQLNALKAESLQTQEALSAEHKLQLEQLRERHEDVAADYHRKLDSLKDEKAALLQEFTERSRQWKNDADLREAGWQKQLRSVESFAERQIRELKEKLEVRTAEAVSNKEVASARLADLEEELVTWQRKHAAMANAHDSAEAEMRAVKDRLARSEHSLNEYKQRTANATRRLQAMAGRDVQLRALWTANRRNNWAARVIQRSYRAFCLQNLQSQVKLNRHALGISSKEKSRLEENSNRLELTVHQQNVEAGKQMFRESLREMDAGILMVRTAFLMPSKDLKGWSNVKKKLANSPRGSQSPRSSLSQNPLTRLSSFISASPATPSQSFITKRAATAEGPLAAGPASGGKSRMSGTYGPGTNIQAHWGSPQG